MQPPARGRSKRGVVIAGAALAVLGLGFYLYARYEYTLVADMREALARPGADAVAVGRGLFETRGCAGCHALAASGSSVSIGPPLDGIGARRTPAEIRRSIVDPGAELAPCGAAPCRVTMPPYGDILDEGQVTSLVAWLAEQR